MRKNIGFPFLILILSCLLISINPYNSDAQISGKPVTPTQPPANLRKAVTPTQPPTSGSMHHLDSMAFEKADCEGDLPAITFPAFKAVTPTQPKSNAATLQPDAIKILQSVAAQLKAKPDCKLKVSGHATSDKMSQQLSWDRVNAIIRYLVEKTGISQNRLIFEYGTEGDPNTVDLMFTSEDGPTSVPQPHPQFRTSGQ